MIQLIVADTAENESDIDVNRAEEALKRAKERLNNKEERIDIERANRALLRAKARLKLK